MAYSFTPTFQYLIDWNNDGVFDDPEFEDVSAYVISAEWSNGSQTAYQLMSDEARAIIVFNNEDRRFSPEFGASPYNDLPSGKLIRPERKIQISKGDAVRDSEGNIVLDELGNTVFASISIVYTGWIETISVDPMAKGTKTATYEATSLKRKLDEGSLRMDLMTDTTADAIIQAILQETIGTDYITNYSQLDVGLQEYPFFGDNFDADMSPYEVIGQVVAAEQGRFFFDQRGRPVFFNSDRLQLTMDLSQTITDDVGDEFLHEMEYGYGDNLKNVIRITFYPRVVAEDLSTLWSLDDEMTLEAGEVAIIRAEYASANGQEVGGLNPVEPNEGDSSLIFSEGSATITSFVSQGQYAEITIENDSSSSDCIISHMHIEAYKITAWDARTIERRDNTSISDFGRRVLELDLRLVTNHNNARMLGDFLRVQLGDPRGLVKSVTVYNRSDDTFAFLSTTHIGDRIRIENTQTNSNEDYFIIGYTHFVYASGLDYSATYYLEPVPQTEAWILGFAGRTELGETTIVGF